MEDESEDGGVEMERKPLRQSIEHLASNGSSAWISLRQLIEHLASSLSQKKESKKRTREKDIEMDRVLGERVKLNWFFVLGLNGFRIV